MKRKTKITLCVSLSIILVAGIMFPIAFNFSKDNRTSIVCTIFPQYDWVKEILGEKQSDFKITYLLEKGVDMHSYQAKVKDVATISKCDLFIYVGGESDEWLEDVLETRKNKNMEIINMMKLLEDNNRILEERDDGIADSDNGGEKCIDEHIWLSLKNARIVVNAIADAICEIDKENEAAYQINAGNYIAMLDGLDGEYENVVNEAKTRTTGSRDTILLGDRFPFLYLVNDYGLNYFAAFQGCSAENEASFETIVFLTDKINAFNIKVILVTETSNRAIANTIKANSAAKNQEIKTLHACQSITSRDVKDGETYVKIMIRNLDVLTQALAR